MAGPRQPFESCDDTMSAFAEHVSRGKVELYQALGLDVVMGRREGIRFWDAFSDRSWINCHCNGGVFNLGHRNPKITAAVREALDELDVGNHHLVSGFRAELGRRLAATIDNHLPGVMFAPGGGEAIDIAIKAARGTTGRQRIISARGGYHGHTGLAVAAGDAEYRDPFGPNLPDFIQVPFDDLAALEAVLDQEAAAVLIEPIPATLGMPIASEGYFTDVQRLCRSWGAKLILDEVQTGLGRTGRTWYALHDDLRPDAIVTGKGLGGGVYPMSAVLLTPELFEFFNQHPFLHITTFGGAELGCVAALAVLDIVDEKGFGDRVQILSDRLAEALDDLPFGIRRCGLMMGFKFGDEGAALEATKGLFDAGVFVVWANNDRSVVQFLPPLVLTDDEADDLIDRVRGVFA